MLPVSLVVTNFGYSNINTDEARITTVNDGLVTLTSSLTLEAMPQSELRPIFEEFNPSKNELIGKCYITLYEKGDGKVLFDVGSGIDFLTGMGSLKGSLEIISINLEDMASVIFTHANPDHILSVPDDFDDLNFPYADYHIARIECEYCWDPDTGNKVDESRVATAVGARRRLEALEEYINLLDDGEEPIFGILAKLTPRYPLGHMSF